MRNRLLELLKQSSLSGLVNFVETSETQTTEEDAPDYTATALATHINFQKLSDLDLLEINDACQLKKEFLEWLNCSPRILLCANKNQITDPHPNDTIVTPEGVWQIGGNFEEHLILNKKDMSTIPSNLLPNTDTSLIIFSSNDDIKPSSIEEIQRAQLLTIALNKAMIKKTNALYVGQQNSISLEKTEKVLVSLGKRIISPELENRNITSIRYKICNLKNEIQLANWAQTLVNELVLDEKAESVGLEEKQKYFLSTLPKIINFHQLSEKDLKSLLYLIHFADLSNRRRLIIAGSIKLANEIDLQQYDTIILPNQVHQMYARGNTPIVLNENETKTSIPQTLLPDFSTEGKEITEEAEKTQLSHCLNQALQNKPDALFIPPGSDEASDYTALVSMISELARTELIKRNTPQPERMLALFSLQTDVEFQTYYWKTMHTPPESDTDGANFELFLQHLETLKEKSNFSVQEVISFTVLESLFKRYKIPAFEKFLLSKKNINTKKISFLTLNNSITAFKAWAFDQHIRNVLQRRIDLDSFSDQQLRTLIQQCEVWTPTHSSRIVCSHSFPEQYQIGDTLIVSEGVYQIRLNSKGIVKKELIMDKKAMENLHLHEYLPENNTERVILDNFKNEQLKELSPILNNQIIKHPKGMYLCPETKEFATMKSILQSMAKEILKARLLQTFQPKPAPKSIWEWGASLFANSKKTPPEPAKVELKPKKTNTGALRSMAKKFNKLKKRLKTLSLEDRINPNISTLVVESEQPQKEAQPPSSIAVQDIINELDLTLQTTHTALLSETNDSVKIMQGKEPVMEFNHQTLAVYKPLIQDINMKNQQKAELFLKALGIPPTKGKHVKGIKGGHHALRKAIRDLFEEYKTKEHLQKTVNFKRKDSDTDTDSSSDSERFRHSKH